jgi:hypothetical protein
MYPEFFLMNTGAGIASFDRIRNMAAVLIPGLERSRGRIEISEGEMV